MKAVTVQTVLVTCVGISVLVGTTLALLTMISIDNDQASGSIIDGGLGVAGLVFLRWSLLTFVCGVPLSLAVVTLGTRFRRAQARMRSAAKRRGLRVRRGE